MTVEPSSDDRQESRSPHASPNAERGGEGRGDGSREDQSRDDRSRGDRFRSDKSRGDRSRSGERRWLPDDPQRRLRWRVTLNAALLVAAILVGDLCLPRGFEIGHLYALPILVSVWTGRPRVVLGFALGCSVLTLLGGFSSWRGTPVDVEQELRDLGRLLPGGEASPLSTLIWTEVGTAWFVQWVVASLGLLRMELEKALASAGDLTALALEGSPDAVVISDEQRRVTVLNRAAEELLGWSFDEARGRPLADVLDLVIDPRDPREHRGQLRPRFGEERPVEFSSALLPDGRGRVVTLRDATRSVAYERHLEDLAFRDRLTGLVNRPALIERLELELAHARRNQSKLAVLFLDLDGFKGVNDTLGHAAGDTLLIAAARGLEDALRETDTIARLGGDEFVVLLPQVRQAEDLEHVARKILARLARPVSVGGTLRGVQPSIGIALFPDHGADGASLLDRADAAMYRAKRDPDRQWVLLPGAHFGLPPAQPRRRGEHSAR